MLGNEYQILAARTINLDAVEAEHHALHGMVAELGEIHSIYQHAYQGEFLTDKHLQKEVGDLLWFIAEFCTARNWKLEDIMQLNIDKLLKRYPDGFDEERSRNREEDI